MGDLSGPEHGIGVCFGCVGHAELALKVWVLWDGLGRSSRKQILERVDHCRGASLNMPWSILKD